MKISDGVLTFSIDSTDSDSDSSFFSSFASFNAAGHLDLVSSLLYEFLILLYHPNVNGVKDYDTSTPWTDDTDS